MPKITRQRVGSVGGNRSGSANILDRITPISKMEQSGLKFSIYGRSGTGKTTIACGFPKPLLLIGTEDGTKSVRTVKGVDFVRVSESKEINELADHLKNSKYKSAILDTASALQGMIIKEFLGLSELPTQYSWGMTDQKGWGAIGVQTKERLRSLIDLADTHQINVVVIAQERNFGEDSETFIITPSVGSALTPGVAGWLSPACDYVCQAFIRQRSEEKITKVGDKEVKIHRNLKGVEYCLRTAAHPVYDTKFRVEKGTPLPEVLVNPEFEDLIKLIQGGASS